jgi:uridine kinase
MDRETLLTALTNRLLALPSPPPARVAIDGADAAGKTTLAGELAERLRSAGRPVLRASIDQFHNPRAVRYQRGPDSPAGYFEDSFNLPALCEMLLDPLGPDGNRVVQTALFDYLADAPAPSEPITAAPDTLLIFDGLFLMRPELSACWDFKIFVQVDFNTILQRAEVRDLPQFGTPAAVRARYLNRYLPAQQGYLSRCRPDQNADVVVINDNPLYPDLHWNA